MGEELKSWNVWDFGDLALRDVFGKVFFELAKKNEKIVVVSADMVIGCRLKDFALKYPKRVFEVGVAEQSMVGIAAGLATFGLMPFAVSFSAFISMRACEFIRTAVAYPRLNVKLIGSHAGLSMGAGGTTHHATEDIAIMRSMANMTVFVPADGNETAKIIEKITEYDGPCYVRFPRGGEPVVYESIGSCPFEIGKSVTVNNGNDITIIAAGPPGVQEGIDSAKELEKEGISVRVVDMASIKPIDKDAIIKAANETNGIITIEDHNIIGGLGSAVAEVVTEELSSLVPVKRIGIPDVYSDIGPTEQLWERYGMTSCNIKNLIREFLNKK